MIKIRLFLSIGKTVDVFCSDDEYGDIYESFLSRKRELPFDNGVFLASEVIGMEYLDVKAGGES